MGQKTHPVQLRSSKPLFSCWYSRSQYADILHYELGLRKHIMLPFSKRAFLGNVFTKWNARGLMVALTCISKKESAFTLYNGDLTENQHASMPVPSTKPLQPFAGQKSVHTGRDLRLLSHREKADHLVPLLRRASVEKGNLHSAQAPMDQNGPSGPLRALQPTEANEPSGTQSLKRLKSPFGPQGPLVSANRAYGWWIQHVHAYSLESPYQTAQTAAQRIVQRIEEGGKIRTILETSIREARNTSPVQGMKIRIAGRLQGAEIASAQNKQWGTLGLHTLSQRVDYAYARAHITAGIIGVQVWVSFRRKAVKGRSGGRV